MRQADVPTYNLYGSTPIIRNPFAKNVFHGAVVPVEVSAAALISMFYDGGYTPKKFGILTGTYAFPQATLKAAEDILKLDFDQADKDRMRQLSAKARAGTLTAKEDSEAGKYELVGHLLNIMQSKARRSLKSRRDDGKTPRTH